MPAKPQHSYFESDNLILILSSVQSSKFQDGIGLLTELKIHSNHTSKDLLRKRDSGNPFILNIMSMKICSIPNLSIDI